MPIARFGTQNVVQWYARNVSQQWEDIPNTSFSLHFQGCCQSVPSNENDATAQPRAIARQPGALAHDSSQAAITQPSPSTPSLSSTTSHRRVSHREERTASNADKPPNQPIRPPTPLRSSPTHISHQAGPWYRAQLERERAAFFETRVTGRPEIWNALKLVSEMLQQGDVEGAQGVIDAVNVTCPNGRVAVGRGRNKTKRGLYDEQGALYELPTWIVTDPRDIIESEEKDDGENSEGKAAEDLATPERRRDDKGKGRAVDVGEMIRVRARLSDGGADIVIDVGTKQRASAIVEQIQHQIGPRRVRLAYLGHVLHENKTLDAQGYRRGDVISAYVFED